MFLSSFVQGQGQQREQKHETKKLVEFHNQPTLTMVYVTAFLKIDLFYKYKEGLRFCKRWPCSMYVCIVGLCCCCYPGIWSVHFLIWAKIVELFQQSREKLGQRNINIFRPVKLNGFRSGKKAKYPAIYSAKQYLNRIIDPMVNSLRVIPCNVVQ